MSFQALFDEVMAGAERFGHRQHVQLTWLAVRRHGTDEAITVVSEGIRQTARYAGAPQKYHATVSRAWVEAVGFHVAEHPGAGSGDPACSGGSDDPAGSGDSACSADSTGFGDIGDIGESGDFDAFAAANPALLDKRLLSRFYSSTLLASPEARSGWVEPDREPFPWRASA